MRDGADSVAERARVQAAVGRAEPVQPDSPTDDGHVIAGNQLPPVLVPRQSRRRRGRRLAEHVDRVALFLDQQARRRLAQHRRRCVTHINNYLTRTIRLTRKTRMPMLMDGLECRIPESKKFWRKDFENYAHSYC